MSDEQSEPTGAAPQEKSWVRVWTPRIAAVALISLGIAAIVGWSFTRLASFFITIIMSLFLAFALAPAVDRLARRGWRRGLATGLVMLVTIIIVFLFLFSFVALLVDQAVILADLFPGWIESFTAWLDETFGIQISAEEVLEQEDQIKDFLLGLSGDVLSAVVGFGGGILGAVFTALTMGLFVFYMTAEAPKLRRAISRPFPPDQQQRMIEVWDEASRQTGNYIYSRSLLAGASAVFHTIAFTLLGLPSPLALGLFVGVVSQFVPNVGTYIAGALPTLVALASGDPIDAVWVIGIIVVYQQFENIVLANKITAQTMDLHPALAFGSVIVGANLLGAAGALLALPVAATVQALVTAALAHRDGPGRIDPVESGFVASD